MAKVRSKIREGKSAEASTAGSAESGASPWDDENGDVKMKVAYPIFVARRAGRVRRRVGVMTGRYVQARTEPNP